MNDAWLGSKLLCHPIVVASTRPRPAFDAMGKKKKTQVFVLKPWCWYCEREFEDEKGKPEWLTSDVS